MKDYKDQLRNSHADFAKSEFNEENVKNPFELFEAWMENAVAQNQTEANAMTLATLDCNQRISARIVYLKEMVNNSFVFYTNYSSKKGKDIALNQTGSILFFWPDLQQQIRIEGKIQKVDAKTSDDYFASRPKASQIGAWASHQSDILQNKEELNKRIEELQTRFPDQVPRPENWGGYALIPDYFEFWQGRPSRLHDRFSFEKEENAWIINRLNP